MFRWMNISVRPLVAKSPRSAGELLQGTDLRPIRLPVRTLPAPGRRSAARQDRRIPRLRSGLIIAGTLA